MSDFSLQCRYCIIQVLAERVTFSIINTHHCDKTLPALLSSICLLWLHHACPLYQPYLVMLSIMSEVGNFLLTLVEYIYLKKKRGERRGGAGEKTGERGVKEVSIEILRVISMLAVLCGCSQTTSHGHVSTAFSVNWKVSIFLFLCLS